MSNQKKYTEIQVKPIPNSKLGLCVYKDSEGNWSSDIGDIPQTGPVSDKYGWPIPSYGHALQVQSNRKNIALVEQGKEFNKVSMPKDKSTPDGPSYG